MQKTSIGTFTRDYDDQIHENGLTVDHVSVYAYDSSLLPSERDSRYRSIGYINRFRTLVKSQSLQNQFTIYKGKKYRILDNCMSQIGNNPVVIMNKGFTDSHMSESIIYKVRGDHKFDRQDLGSEDEPSLDNKRHGVDHGLWFTLNFHKNVRRRYGVEPYLNTEFDQKIRINNDNYLIPEVFDEWVLQKTLFQSVDEVLPVANKIYQKFYGVDAPVADKAKMSQVEITRDYTVPNFMAQRYVWQFIRYLMSPEGIEWRQSNGFEDVSYLGRDIRGDSSILLVRSKPHMIFKCYAKNMITVRTEIRIERKSTFNYLCVSRDLKDIREVYNACGEILRQLDVSSLIHRFYEERRGLDPVLPKYVMRNFADLITRNMCTYGLAVLSHNGVLPAGKFRKWLTPELRKLLEPIDSGSGKGYRLPLDQPHRKKCKNCRNIALVSTVQCPRCKGYRFDVIDSNVGVIR